MTTCDATKKSRRVGRDSPNPDPRGEKRNGLEAETKGSARESPTKGGLKICAQKRKTKTRTRRG